MATIKITKPSYIFEQGVHRVSAFVQDKPLWFETSDISLGPSAEAILSAILVPALESKYDIQIDAPLSPVWISNIKELSKVFTEWWAYRGIEFHGSGTKLRAEDGKQKTALCFSGGVDSFFNLLRGSQKIDYLVSAFGFDVQLCNTKRLASFQSSLRDISEKTNTTSIIINTNLRDHPISNYANWEKSHGGALAALGHLLNRHFDKLVISASYALDFERPWGSHWKTDHFWSSETLQIIHEGERLWRSDKLRAIMDEPLVRKHLRVCYENEVPLLNCGRCEKCIRTMLILTQSRRLDYFPCFKNPHLLVENINKLHRVGEAVFVPYQKLLDRGLETQLAKAVQSLLKRSKREHKKPKKILKNQISNISQRIKRPFKKKLTITFR